MIATAATRLVAAIAKSTDPADPLHFPLDRDSVAVVLFFGSFAIWYFSSKPWGARITGFGEPKPVRHAMAGLSLSVSLWVALSWWPNPPVMIAVVNYTLLAVTIVFLLLWGLGFVLWWLSMFIPSRMRTKLKKKFSRRARAKSNSRPRSSGARVAASTAGTMWAATEELERTLYPSRAKWIQILIGCTVFAAVGVLMLKDSPYAAWVVIGLFGPGIPVCLVNLAPGSGHLRLTLEGYEVRALFHTRRRERWANIEEFCAFENPTIATRHVGIRYVANHTPLRRTKLLRRANRMLLDLDDVLPDSYGLSADDLASLLNQRLNGPKSTEPGPGTDRP